MLKPILIGALMMCVICMSAQSIYLLDGQKSTGLGLSYLGGHGTDQISLAYTKSGDRSDFSFGAGYIFKAEVIPISLAYNHLLYKDTEGINLSGAISYTFLTSTSGGSAHLGSLRLGADYIIRTKKVLFTPNGGIVFAAELDNLDSNNFNYNAGVSLSFPKENGGYIHITPSLLIDGGVQAFSIGLSTQSIR